MNIMLNRSRYVTQVIVPSPLLEFLLKRLSLTLSRAIVSLHRLVRSSEERETLNYFEHFNREHVETELPHLATAAGTWCTA